MSDGDLAGPVAVVTGATGHLGAAICRVLSDRGITVVGGYHANEQRAANLTAEIGEAGGSVRMLRADLADPDGVPQLLAELRRDAMAPQILVCAHGATARRSVLTHDRADAGRLWTLNVASVLQLASATARGMMRRRTGRIVLLGSRGGCVGMPGQADYAATKIALSGWAASAAWELGPYGITVNVLAPGAVEPDPHATSAVYTADEDRAVIERIALRRLATADEIARVAAFLAGPDSGCITGQTLLADGGARW